MDKKKKLCIIILCAAAVFGAVLLQAYFSSPQNMLKEIEKGNIRHVKDKDDTRKIAATLVSDPDNKWLKWIYKDLNGDGEEDLIELISRDDVAAIFTVADKEVDIVLYDMVDADYYYRLCDRGLMYGEHEHWLFKYESYVLFSYDENWNKIFLGGLELCYYDELDETGEYNREELVESINKSLTNKINRQLDTGEDELYCLEFEMRDGEREYTEITQEEWKRKFSDLFGQDYEEEFEGVIFSYYRRDHEK